jgi:hypothetical protein
LTGNSAIFISDVANGPGKIIKDFRKKSAKPVLKAYIMLKFILDDQLDALATIKSKEKNLSGKSLVCPPAQSYFCKINSLKLKRSY